MVIQNKRLIGFVSNILIYSSIIVLIGMYANVFAVGDTANAEVDASYNVSITGKAGAGAGSQVQLVVIDPDGQVDEMNQKTALAEGSFSFSYRLKQPPSEGEYLVKVNGVQVTTFIFISDSVLLERINYTSVNAMAQFLKTYSSRLNIDLNGDYKLLSDKTPVHQALVGKNFSQIGDVSIAFTQSVEVQKQKELQMVALSAVNQAVESEIGMVLSNNNAALNLDLSGYYYNLADKYFVHHQLVITNFSEIEEIRSVFQQAVAVSAVNEATRKTITQVLSDQASILGMSLTGTYGDLSTEKQNDVKLALLDRNFESINAVVVEFNEAILAASKDNSGNHSGGRSSSSGGHVTNITQVISSVPEMFVDLTTVPWASESIQQLAVKGIVSGEGNGRFRPDDKVTREEFLKMLLTAFGLVQAGAISDFKDIQQSEWYYPYIASGQRLNIIQGLDNGNFGIGKEITREDMAVMSYRIAKLANAKFQEGMEALQFADSNEIEEYAVEGIKMMQYAGIINGVGEERFAPKDVSTRAMAAKVVYELLKYSNKL